MNARLVRQCFTFACLVTELTAVACVLSGSAFHLSAQTPATNGMRPGRPLHVEFQGEQPRPLAMVAGDFDEDGVGDLAIGYALSGGGSIALLHGNLDAHAPQSQESWLAAGHHQYSDPYLQTSKPLSIKSQPGLMVAADVNGDGHLDLVFAATGSSQIFVMFGDGKGNFLAPLGTSVGGPVTALTAFRPGVPLAGEAIVAGLQSDHGAELSILSGGTRGFAVASSYALPGAATALSVANLDADNIPDIAVVAAGELLVLHGKGAVAGQSSLTTVPIGGVESVATGEFLFDRHAQLQLSVVTTNGDVVVFAHEGFDSRPYTPQEIAVVRRGKKGQANTQSLAQQTSNTGDAPWMEVERSSGVAPHSVSGHVPILLRSRVSGSKGDDLLLLNSSSQQLTLIRHSMKSPHLLAAATSASASSASTSSLAQTNVVAALTAAVTPDARQGLLSLSADNLSPQITLPSAGNTFFVNTLADNTGSNTDPSDGIRCTEGSGEICTLRDAVTFANNDGSDNIASGKSDTIMVPAGTYTLTWQAGTTDGNTNALTHLEILGPVTIIGSTTGGGTIINAANNDIAFSINPGSFGSFNPSSESYVFDAALENLVIENAKNTNNLNNSLLANFVGGAINWDAFGEGNLTLTNTTIQNSIALWGSGGGIWAQNSAGGGTGTLTINGGSISNNSTAELGGGIDVTSPAVALAVSNTTISGNTAQISVNPSDGDADGSGGGLFLEGRVPPSATPRSTLTGVTIASNIAANDNGGGIATFAGILLSGSVIRNNTTGGSGGGIWSNAAGDGSQTTITSSNFLSNSATTSGGAIALGLESPASGNILQVSLSRIFGNTSTGGASGLANGVSGEGAGQAIATEDWWGCNSGPTTASDGCDQAVLYNGGGSLTTAPFATLGFSSDITTIPAGGSMNLTVSLNTDSNNNLIGGAFPAVDINYPYTFTVLGVTATPALTTGIFNTSGTSGVGTAVLTPSSTGNGTVTVTFDNQTDSINFTAQAAATATSLSLSAIPSTSFLYGQPSGFTVQLTPSDATGITSSNFQILVDGASSLGGSAFGLILIGSDNYQIFGPFNLLAAGGHTLRVNFLGTSNFGPSNASASLNVLTGTVAISNTVTPAKPVQGQTATATVTVAGIGSGAGPTGSILYAFNGGNNQTAPLTGGVATISIPTVVQTGINSLSLGYSGDANYATASTSASFTVSGQSRTTIATLTTTTAQINVYGLGFAAPSGQLAFTDTTSGSPVAAPITLNTAAAMTALLPQTTTSTGVGTLPDWTTLGDVNGDGKLDLITSIFGADSVDVQLGNGDGTFAAAASILISPGFGPAEDHLVSLRDNGTLDLIVGSANTNRIAVLLGNGNGTFQPPVFYTSGSAINKTSSLTTGDFNHDGNLDVAVANMGDNSVTVLLGNGSGALTPIGAPIVVGQAPESIRSGDFNSDGFDDLAVANFQSGTVTGLLNNRNGTFTPSPINVGSGSGSGPRALAITGTGTSLQLAVANFNDGTVSVLKSNNDGTFAPQTIVTVGAGPIDVGFADFNGDSVPDLAVSNSTGGSISLVLGSAGGGYSTVGPFLAGSSPHSVAIGDLDFDSTPDIVVPNYSSNNVGVLLSGSQISVPYNGLSLTPGDTFNATYTPDGASLYGGSVSPNVTAAANVATSLTITSSLGSTFNHGQTPAITLALLPADATGVTAANFTATLDGAPLTISSTATPNVYTLTGAALSSLSVDGHTIQANFLGAAGYSVSSGSLSLTVTKANATVGLGNLAQTYNGSPLAASATTTPAGLAVSFTYNGLPAVPTDAGSYTVVATIDDPNYAGSATDTLVISKAAATVTLGNLAQTYTGSPLAPSATTTPAGLAISFTYNGLPAVPTAAGSYTVAATINDTNYLGSATGTLVISKATANVTLGNLAQTYTGSPLAASATTTPAGLAISFTYNGLPAVPTAAGSYTVAATINDTNYLGSATGTLVISKATATVTLGSLAQTYNGLPLAASATTTPAGLAVNFTYSGLPTAPTAAGSYTVAATINDTNYLGSATGTLVISKATAAVSLGNLAQTYTGSPLAASATTTPAGLAVNFTYNGSPTVPTAAGSYTVAATINDTNYAGSTTGTLVISKATPTITWPAPSAITYGTPLSSAQLNATISAVGSFSYNPVVGAVLPAGTQTLNASFTPTDTTDYNGATHSVTLTVNKQATTVALASSAIQITPGQTVSFTATVAPASNGSPSGTVSFYDGTTLLGTSTVSSGTAGFATSALATGVAHNILATYSGDGDYLGSSATSGINITVGLLDFTFTSTGPTNTTVVPGGSVSFTYMIAPLFGGYPAPVNFTVTGLPPGATYTLSQSSISAASGVQTIVLTVKTAPLTARDSKTSAPWSLALLLLPLAGARRLRRSSQRVRRAALLGCVLLAGSAALLGLSGCGASNGFLGQPPTNYTVTVTATSGGIQHVSTFTLNLQ